MNKLAVIGNPVKHSLSPQIFTLFAKQMGVEIQYDKVFSELKDFSHTVTNLREQDYMGANVTVPFKQEAFEFADEHAPSAQAVGVANVLIFQEDGSTIAHNTDGIGIVNDVSRQIGEIKDKSILLLGAGGAAKGALYSLLQQQPSKVTLVNRTASRAVELREQFEQLGNIQTSSFEALSQPCDIIINATSSGLHNTKLPIPIHVLTQQTLCYDMVYGKSTPFLQWAEENGAQTSDGLGMLVEQAAEGCKIWFGERPETATVLAALAQLVSK
tara:strand:- start:30891 stop:31703 length:813 start_codon:yes stop_codon:yes gene_type:complete